MLYLYIFVLPSTAGVLIPVGEIPRYRDQPPLLIILRTFQCTCNVRWERRHIRSCSHNRPATSGPESTPGPCRYTPLHVQHGTHRVRKAHMEEIQVLVLNKLDCFVLPI